MKRKLTEDTILNAAKKIVMNNGLSGLTARKVAKSSGYSVGTIYNIFRNMNDLTLKINADTLLQMRDELQEAIAKKRSNQSLGRVLAKFYIQFANAHTPFWNLLFDFKYPRGETLPKWYNEIVDGNFKVLEEAISPLLGNDPQLTHQASRVMWASFHGIITLSLDGKLRLASTVIPEKLSESLFENYIKGLST